MPELPPAGSDEARVFRLLVRDCARARFAGVPWAALGLSEDEVVDAVLELIAAGHGRIVRAMAPANDDDALGAFRLEVTAAGAALLPGLPRR